MAKECGEKNEYIQLLIFQALQENQDEVRIEKDNKRMLQIEKEFGQDYDITDWVVKANYEVAKIKKELQIEKEQEEIARANKI